MSGIIYITYRKNGTLQKASVRATQYEVLQRDNTISELTLHPNNRLMEKAYNEASGSVSSKQILLG